MRSAVFSCLGLGDGLLALILSNNLRLNGDEAATFHPSLSGLQEWFPHLPIKPFPSLEKLASFDRFFIFFEKTPRMQAILEECQKRYPEKTTVLNPIATPNRDYPYWEEGKFDGKKCMAENLYAFCNHVLRLPNPVRENGLVPLEGLKGGRFPKRVVLHPTSSKPGKNWPREKYTALAARLEKEGFEPAFILGPNEREGWEEVNAPLFSSLSEMAAFVYESGAMIGNDSGIGHLASCMGLPTLTICRNKQTGQFWRPGWSKGEIVFPPSWIPNLKGLRLRDKYWKRWIPVRQVYAAFNGLSKRAGVS